ncbi:MAG: hypothetical protein PVG79_02090 [Gemmatimonadales bacterium]|jgi:uncharacterized repeat protein (TIGR01451 family)
MNKWLHAATLLGLAVPLIASPVSAQETESLVITAENLMAGDARHQEIASQGGDPSTALPGDVILYRLTFTNTTDVPVRNVEFKDPLPAGLHYVIGSATADRDAVLISYSIDGGQIFSAEPLIEVVVDGERVTRPAPPELYTHIRWLVTGWVQPGAQVTAEFRAQLPAAGAPEEPGEPK